ncbi:glycoside hydrolase family protein [Acidithiobacillus thiooxidans]|uniref:glycoside hydrolase family protein n=1 Tax=Acidithiobacillus thiooxidans TaxID=930 RepID=UPI003568AE18
MALKEGIAQCMYHDSRGLATIGIGHLIQPRGSITAMPTKAPAKFEQYRNGLTDEEINEIKRQDIQKVVKDVADPRIKVKLNACQTDALISLFFNAGAGGKQRLYDSLNKCDFSAAATYIKNYGKKKDGTYINPELEPRRREEANLFLHCKYPSGTAARVRCCTYKLTKTFPEVKPGEYQAKCKSNKGKTGCQEGGKCYGI